MLIDVMGLAIQLTGRNLVQQIVIKEGSELLYKMHMTEDMT